MHLTAIVCTYKRYDLLSAVMASLAAQRGVDAFDVLIVDNSPDRSIAQEFAARHEQAPYTFLYEEKPGLSNARNVGAHAARGDILAYIDDDALASPGWARAIVEAFISFGPETGVVGGPVEPLWSAPPPKWLARRSLDMLSIIDRGPVAREMEPHEWLAGCNIAFRRDFLLAVGGFPVDLGRSGDDTSLLSNEEYVVCERLMQAGRKMIYTPEARVRHRIPPSRVSPQWLVKRMAWQAISDAVSHPSRSAEHALWKSEISASARLLRSIRFFWIMSEWKRSVSDEELEIVYDMFNAYICGKS